MPRPVVAQPAAPRGRHGASPYSVLNGMPSGWQSIRLSRRCRCACSAVAKRTVIGREAWLGYLGRVLMEHRAGLIVKTAVTPADGHGERDAALVQRAGVAGRHWITVAADKGYDTRGLTARFPVMHVTPHLAQHATGRRSANR